MQKYDAMIREFNVFNNVRRGKIGNNLNKSSLVVASLNKERGRNGFAKLR